MKVKMILVTGGILAFMGVAMGAIGSHLLKSRISSELLVIYETGNRYHTIHSLGIILASQFYLFFPRKEFKFSSYSFILGIIFFSGSLYLLAITGDKFYGKITPIGGVFFLMGWVILISGFLKSKIKEE
jgi:uncharacterized membrane protein YgdD (TMEM256/DUF423 family)